ncbi:MAG: porphobilinogen synthase [Eubacteriales bacterium]
MLIRPRRLRLSDSIRKLTRETRISADSLIYPIFIEEGENIVKPISTMPGQYRYSIDTVKKELDEVVSAGVRNIIIFGAPKQKDEAGSGAYSESGVVQQAVAAIKREYKQLYVVGDVCMCEYTSSGHCGITKNDTVDNDATLPLLARIAVSQAKAGADMVAPSDMMDGRVLEIRKGLDEAGFEDTPIMAYSAKYASAFYGPFREAAGSDNFKGHRKTYQMDCHNAREALKEVRLDVLEGADIVMVKPALSYLDIIKSVKEDVNIPVAAYSVSGEYAMIKAAAMAGMVDEESIIAETAVSMFRAGSDILITYFAKEIAKMIKEGRIG